MPIQGNLLTMAVPEILMWISQFQKTGTLEIRIGETTSRLAFDHGALIFSSSSDHRSTLGRLLIEKGVVTEEMHARARQLREEKSSGVAKALRDLKILSEEQVVTFLRKKAEKELFELFEAKEGEFTFDEKELPALDLLPLRVDVSRLLLRVTQQMDEKGEYDFDASGIRLEIPRDI
ncbi:MAG TPA: DUF4388 domain-containing protein [Thermoanaerobaculia bacterium]|nr:DUF4388 domain-containing protein [Thermoanaerobaculia bacterium]